ncbi:MAG: hypothetical protein ABR588_05940 [Sphingomicrobium sp.]|nr:hypothetical protein [Sphingomonadales bacterium]
MTKVQELVAILPDLIAQREAEQDKRKRKRKQLSSRIKAARIVIAWARTRAGYVKAGS